MAISLPYQTPVISYPLPPGTYQIEIEATGAASGMFSGFADEFFWNGSSSGANPRPVFPYLAPALEDHLNNIALDTTVFRCRWVFGSGGSVAAWTPGSNRDLDPKLVIQIENNENYTSGTFRIIPSAPNSNLGRDYDVVDQNWVGIFINREWNFADPVPSGIDHPYVMAQYAPACTWNPGVLQYGDRRSRVQTAGESVNARSHRKVTTIWGESYRRVLTFPLVRATQMYGYRRINELFEPDSTRRNSPTNLYEGLTRSLDRDLRYTIFTEIPQNLSMASSPYHSGFRGRTAFWHQGLVGDDSGGWDFQEDDQRLYNVTIEFTEADQDAQGTTPVLGM